MDSRSYSDIDCPPSCSHITYQGLQMTLILADAAATVLNGRRVRLSRKSVVVAWGAVASPPLNRIVGMPKKRKPFLVRSRHLASVVSSSGGSRWK